MKVTTEFKGNYPEDPIRFFNFDELVNGIDDIGLYYGLGSHILNNGEKFKIYLDLEEPLLLSHNILTYHKNFHKILTLCPFSAEWYNNQIGEKKVVATYFTFNPQYTPETEVNKEYDVIYTGSGGSPEIKSVLEIIGKFNHKHVGFDSPTEPGCSYKRKLKLIAQSKITIVHNLFFFNDQWKQKTKEYDRSDNKAYEKVQELGLVPHLKSRSFEPAFCRSLMLVRKDPWNVIEKYFKPNVHFIYYEDGKLDKTIEYFLKNYGQVQDIIENAYKHANKHYTTNRFFKDFINDRF